MAHLGVGLLPYRRGLPRWATSCIYATPRGTALDCSDTEQPAVVLREDRRLEFGIRRVVARQEPQDRIIICCLYLLFILLSYRHPFLITIIVILSIIIITLQFITVAVKLMILINIVVNIIIVRSSSSWLLSSLSLVLLAVVSM